MPPAGRSEASIVESSHFFVLENFYATSRAATAIIIIGDLWQEIPQ
jgi:hypothetical protein